MRNQGLAGGAGAFAVRRTEEDRKGQSAGFGFEKKQSYVSFPCP
jgi:hypothetical protein